MDIPIFQNDSDNPIWVTVNKHPKVANDEEYDE